MFGSPIVVQKKASAPTGGSSNPFDDYDVFAVNHLVNDLSLGAHSGNLNASPVLPSRMDRVDSEDDYLKVFGGESSSPSPPSRSSKSPSFSGMRNEIRAADSFGGTFENDDDEDTTSDISITGAPPIPPRAPIPEGWVQRIRDPIIPYHESDEIMYTYVITPIEEDAVMRMSITYDAKLKVLKLVHDSTGRVLLTALKRQDGLKAYSLSANFTIYMMPTDKDIERERLSPSLNPTNSVTEPVRVGKVRSNLTTSQYSVFDQGKSPSKSVGVMEMRRELLTVRFESLSGIYTRRASFCSVPLPQHTRRPSNKEETLAERAKRNDPTVVSFSPFIPTTKRLPRAEEYGSFTGTQSIKNMMLHDPRTNVFVFRMGRVDESTYRIEFRRPFSIAAAFGLAIASIDTKIHPSRQL